VKQSLPSQALPSLCFLHIQLINFQKLTNGETKMKFGFTPEAELLNSRLAMLGFVIAVGTYLTTGQIVPGVW
jgi:hypothetical protein